MTAASVAPADTTATAAAITADTAIPASAPTAAVIVAIAADGTTTHISAATVVTPVRQPSTEFPHGDSCLYL